MQHNGLLINPN